MYIMRNNMDKINLSSIPNLIYLIEYKDLFVNEYMNYYSTNNWTFFDINDPSIDYNILKTYDLFRINQFLFKNNAIINLGRPTVKNMWFKLNGLSIDENIIYAPQTDKYVNTIDNIVNYGIMVVEPGYDDTVTYTNYNNVVRYYLPLFIPIGDNGMNINQNGDISLDNADLENNSMAFNINGSHRFWNYSNTNLAMLFMDIKLS